MATAYSEFDSTPATIINDVRAKILQSSDWADLTPTAVLTTTTAAYASGAGNLNISSTATNAPGLSVGDVIIIDKGLATEERLTINGRNSATAMQVTPNTTQAHASGATVHSGRALLKATTTDGAQMVVDLADALGGAQRLSMGVYRTHDGTTGVDKLQRYLNWRDSGGATTDPLHCVVSAGKEHVWITIEGPRLGEPNVSGANGSYRQTFALLAVAPYFDNDTTPAVACIGHYGTSGNDSSVANHAHISRNRAGTASWVQARLLTMAVAVAPTTATFAPMYTTTPSAVVAGADGNTYFWPYVVVEATDGLRGRLKPVLFAGFNSAVTAGDPIWVNGQKVVVGGVSYTAISTHRYHNTNPAVSPFGASYSTTTPTVLIPS